MGRAHSKMLAAMATCSLLLQPIGLPAEQLNEMIQAGSGGHPRHGELIVDATTRKGRHIRCRVIAHTLGDGERPSGVVVVMEELKPEVARL